MTDTNRNGLEDGRTGQFLMVCSPLMKCSHLTAGVSRALFNFIVSGCFLWVVAEDESGPDGCGS